MNTDSPCELLDHAKVGGPPHDFASLKIVDLDNPERVVLCTEVNAKEGWAQEYNEAITSTTLVRGRYEIRRYVDETERLRRAAEAAQEEAFEEFLQSGENDGFTGIDRDSLRRLFFIAYEYGRANG